MGLGGCLARLVKIVQAAQTLKNTKKKKKEERSVKPEGILSFCYAPDSLYMSIISNLCLLCFKF